jgi:hypothetical protein
MLFGSIKLGFLDALNSYQTVRFQVLTAARMTMTPFWDTAPCSLVERERSDGGLILRYYPSICLHGLRKKNSGLRTEI